MTALFTIIWACIIAAFAATESAALAIEWRQHRGDLTFSELWWRTFHVRDPRPTPAVWALRGLALAALVWATLHLGFGWLSL